MSQWLCLKNCGACCNLNPDDRPDLDQYLTPENLQLYLSLVGEDGWCVNYDQDNRECRIYDDRPSFCRVLPENFAQMYAITESEFNDFAIDCCCQQIEGVYGEDSEEMQRYLLAIDNE